MVDALVRKVHGTVLDNSYLIRSGWKRYIVYQLNPILEPLERFRLKIIERYSRIEYSHVLQRFSYMFFYWTINILEH